jgi:hypothetical protein
MGLIEEPKNIDFTFQSEPWTEEELRDFRKIMNELKAKNVIGRIRSLSMKKNIGV